MSSPDPLTAEERCPRCGHRTCPSLRGEQSPEAEEYHLLLLRTMRECDHPPRFRADPGWPSPDPSEWQCEVCGTAQFKGTL
jgi:hypothetical protein